MEAFSPRARLAAALLPFVLAPALPAVAAANAAHNDLDGDGRSDVVWQHGETGRIVYWSAGRHRNATSIEVTAPAGFDLTTVALRGAGNYSDKPHADLMLQHRTTGAFHGLSRQPGGGYSAASVYTGESPSPAWTYSGAGDFDGDDAADPVLRNAATGKMLILFSFGWYGYEIGTVADLQWRVAGIGDFDGDGYSDIAWRHALTGSNVLWLGGMASERVTLPRVADLDWQVAGIGDFDGDGRSDIFWRHATTGRNQIWRSGQATSRTVVTAVTRTTWKVASVGDFDGDGTSDLLWRNTSTGSAVIWYSANIATRRTLGRVTDPAWSLVP